jgi:elongation factor G
LRGKLLWTWAVADHSLIEIAIEPKDALSDRAMAQAVEAFASTDATLQFRVDQESRQMVLAGQSEDQIERALSRLIDGLGLRIDVGAPQVAYRESLGKKADIDYTHKKQTGGTGQFARVMITFEPGEPGSGFVFESKIVGGAIPKEFIPGVEKGLESIKEGGLLAGFPLIDFKATLTDGKYHDVDSSVLAFEIAARAAFRELREKGAPKLLEPIMKVEVLTPDDCAAAVVADLQGRRGWALEARPTGDRTAVRALAPLSLLLGYTAILHALCQGRAEASLELDHYAPAPGPHSGPDLFPQAAARRA